MEIYPGGRFAMSEKLSLLALRIGFVVALLITAAVAVELPAAMRSILQIMRQPTHIGLPITPENLVLQPNHSDLEIDLQNIDEVARTITAQIRIYHHCATGCGDYIDRVHIFQAVTDETTSRRMPPSVVFDIPNVTGDSNRSVAIPVRGDVLYFPLDRYDLSLGFAIERVFKDQPAKYLTAQEGSGAIEITIDERLARLEMVEFKVVPPASAKLKAFDLEYLYVAQIGLERPAFIQLVTIIVTLLTVLVSIYTTLTRPFDTLLLGAGTSILGIYGARSLVLGGFPVDSTLIDTTFAGVVLFNLVAITFRAANHFHALGGLKLLPWAIKSDDP